MKFPLDPSHFEIPVSLATGIIGAALSAAGIVVATLAGWWVRLANIDLAELAIQPLHVVLIGLIVLFAFVAGLMALVNWVV